MQEVCAYALRGPVVALHGRFRPFARSLPEGGKVSQNRILRILAKPERRIRPRIRGLRRPDIYSPVKCGAVQENGAPRPGRPAVLATLPVAALLGDDSSIASNPARCKCQWSMGASRPVTAGQTAVALSQNSGQLSLSWQAGQRSSPPSSEEKHLGHIMTGRAPRGGIALEPATVTVWAGCVVVVPP